MIPVHERKILEAHVRGIPFSRLALETRELNEYEDRQLRELIKERVKGIPLQYLTGTQDFFGREFYVNTSVLIPRPETEGLVELALKNIPSEESGKRLNGLELGTGSGCISITLAMQRHDIWMTATDCSTDALTVAEENCARFRTGNVDFHHVSTDTHCWQYQDFPQFDFIISNPPYLSKDDNIAADVRVHEPEEALFAPAEDPLHFYRFLLELMKTKLKSTTGLAFFEIAENRAEETAQIFQTSGYNAVVHNDLAGRSRYLFIKPV